MAQTDFIPKEVGDWELKDSARHPYSDSETFVYLNRDTGEEFQVVLDGFEVYTSHKSIPQIIIEKLDAEDERRKAKNPPEGA